MRPSNQSKQQRGFSLVEVMVATAILVVVLVGILMLYDRANRVFKSGNEAAEMQQNLRIAYERLVSDVRMAGFDYSRGGVPSAGQSRIPAAFCSRIDCSSFVCSSTLSCVWAISVM